MMSYFRNRHAQYDFDRREYEHRREVQQVIKEHNDPCDSPNEYELFIMGRLGGGGMKGYKRGPIPPSKCCRVQEETSIPNHIGEPKQCVRKTIFAGEDYYTCSKMPVENPLEYGTPYVNCRFWGSGE